jgi:DNA-binding PadR family transcriptional regulator
LDPYADYNGLMQAPLTTKVALLQILREGPSHGRELIRRAHRMTGGRLRLSPGRVYPALQALAAERLISGRSVSAGGARGARSRICYELTARGVAASTEQRAVLAAVIHRSTASVPDAGERARMAKRLLDADDLSRAGADVERAMRRKERG